MGNPYRPIKAGKTEVKIVNVNIGCIIVCYASSLHTDNQPLSWFIGTINGTEPDFETEQILNHLLPSS